MENPNRVLTHSAQPTEKRMSLLAPPRHTLTLFGIVTVLVVAGAFNASQNATVSQVPDPGRMIKNDVIMIGMLWLWVYFVFKGMKEYDQSILQFFGWESLSLRELFRDLMVGFLAFVTIYACATGVHMLLPSPAINNPLLAATPHGIAGAVVWVSLSISAGICEEIVFRGYLQRQLASMTGNVGIAIVVQAIVFGVGHAYEGITSVLAIILHGLVLGIVAKWRGNIRAGIVEHAGWNMLAGFGLLSANW
jgi:membrane protease YdiL (CAAX protease family)